MNSFTQLENRAGRFVFLVLVGCLTLAAWLPARATAHEVTITNSVTLKHGEKLNPKFWVGNVDDPVPPPDYLPRDHNRVHKWYWRNNAHNFTFYIIGIADKKFRRSGHYPDQVFNPHGGWNWAVCKYKWARLPFVSFQKHKFAFYLGWRERGNFGIKLTFR